MTDASNELICPHCDASNPAGKSFCGDCGRALAPGLAATAQYIDERMKSFLADHLQDQKAVELETSERIAERTIKWAKIAGVVMSVPVLFLTGILSFFGYRTFSDYEKFVDVAAAANTKLTETQAQFVVDAEDANTKLTETQARFVADAKVANAKMKETLEAVDATREQAQQAQGELGELLGSINSMQEKVVEATQRLEKLEQSRARTTEAIASATRAPVSPLPIESPFPDPKGAIAKIPRLIEEGATALSFELGHGGYYGPAIWLYVDNLIRSPSFRFVVILDENRVLFGVYEASTLVAALNPPDARALSQQFPLESHNIPTEEAVAKWTEFARKLNEGAAEKIRSYPGFISAQHSVYPNAEKRDVLVKMAKLNVDWLPAVDGPGGKFIGIVNRTQLTASLLLDIASAVRAGEQ